MKFIDLYSLVPINDGLRCLCKDSEGNHYVASKTHHDRNERLLFEDEALVSASADSLKPENMAMVIPMASPVATVWV